MLLTRAFDGRAKGEVMESCDEIKFEVESKQDLSELDYQKALLSGMPMGSLQPQLQGGQESIVEQVSLLF